MEHKTESPSGGNTESVQGKETEQTGHTPGPWEQFPYENMWDGHYKTEVRSHNEIVATLRDCSKANARLIAAAPDYHREAFNLAMRVLQSDLYKDNEARTAVDNLLLIRAKAQGVPSPEPVASTKAQGKT